MGIGKNPTTREKSRKSTVDGRQPVVSQGAAAVAQVSMGLNLRSWLCPAVDCRLSTVRLPHLRHGIIALAAPGVAAAEAAGAERNPVPGAVLLQRLGEVLGAGRRVTARRPRQRMQSRGNEALVKSQQTAQGEVEHQGSFRPTAGVVKSGDRLPQSGALGQPLPLVAQLFAARAGGRATRNKHQPAAGAKSRARLAHNFAQSAADTIAHDRSADLSRRDESHPARSALGVVEHRQREEAARPGSTLGADAAEFSGLGQARGARQAQAAGARSSRRGAGR